MTLTLEEQNNTNKKYLSDKLAWMACDPKFIDLVSKVHKEINSFLDKKNKSRSFTVDLSKVPGYNIKILEDISCFIDYDNIENDFSSNLKEILEERRVSKDKIQALINSFESIFTVTRKQYFNNLSKIIDIDPRDYLYKYIDEFASQYFKIKGLIQIEIDTSIEGFLSLGHNYCDQESCFARERGHSIDKVRLASIENSFVIKQIKDKKVVARCWGIMQNDKFYIHNVYCKGASSTYFLFGIIEILKSFYGDIKTEIITSLYDYVYVNNEIALAIAPSDKRFPAEIYLQPNEKLENDDDYRWLIY